MTNCIFSKVNSTYQQANARLAGALELDYKALG
jgi:hypothetical protein